MRRIATVLGALMTAVVAVTATPGSAYAATGTLIVNGELEVDPAGCYSPEVTPLVVSNQTDHEAVIYEAEDCLGKIIKVVPAGEKATSYYGFSVYVG